MLGSILGCDTKLQKPFIIIDKQEVDFAYVSQYEKSYYTYQDKNGRTMSFWDLSSKYNIGDTLK